MKEREARADSAVFVAAERGDLRALRMALRPRGLWRRTDLNVRNGDGWTPLHHAAAYGQVAVARILLERGADPAPRNYLGLTPLDYAACYGQDTLATLLVERGARHTLHSAAALGVPWALRGLLAGRENLDQRDYFGYTPLHWAARHGRCEAAELLLEHGAGPNACDGNGETPLRQALAWGQERVAQLLRARGAVEEVSRKQALAG